MKNIKKSIYLIINMKLYKNYIYEPMKFNNINFANKKI